MTAGVQNSTFLPGTSQRGTTRDGENECHLAIHEQMGIATDCGTKERRVTPLMCRLRKLTEVSEFDAYPMPRVDEILNRLGQANYISSIDMTKGYWQIPLAEESKDKTAFTTPFGLFEFCVMPFGLHGAPATFQRLMDNILLNERESSDAYIDDVTVASETFKDLTRDLTSMREAGLTIKPAKTNLAMSSVGAFGHRVGRGVIKPDPTKIAAVSTYPRPKTKKDLRAFLGLTGYYRKFIPDFSGKTALLYLSDMLKMSSPEQLNGQKKVKWRSATSNDCFARNPCCKRQTSIDALSCRPMHREWDWERCSVNEDPTDVNIQLRTQAGSCHPPSATTRPSSKSVS